MQYACGRRPAAGPAGGHGSSLHAVIAQRALPRKTAMATLVIGAGTAGLAMARELQDRGEDFLLVERRANVGGLWNYESTSDEKGDGSAIPGDGLVGAGFARPLYGALVTNLPKDMMNFADTPFDESVPEFPETGKEHFLAYLQQFAATHGLDNQIELDTIATAVTWDAEAKLWAVTTAPASAALDDASSQQVRLFANVAVANGHHAEPIVPLLPGQTGFPGKIMHSCSFDSPNGFEGKTVVVLGGSISAGQIAEILDAAGTCTAVHLSTRKPTATAYRGLTGGAIASAKNNGVSLHTELSELCPDGSITFKDGTAAIENVDYVICATGYANCNLNANFEKNFLLKMQRLGGIVPEK